MRRPRLRDNRAPAWPYAPDQVPHDYVIRFAKEITRAVYLGDADVGADWADMFAASVGGEHLASPIGHVDVVKGAFAWSIKTVKANNPHGVQAVRIVSGRNSPDHSYEIENPHEDIEKTGEAVLGIWNERVRLSLTKCPSVPRISILVRNVPESRFTYFEFDTKTYEPSKYVWVENARGNLEGHEKATDKHFFTWQPHGSQFTIKYDVPEHATKFSIKKPGSVDAAALERAIGFDDSWVTIE